jgi:hypothetical protein
MTNRVSELTAKEMTKVEVNSVLDHRKFDGKLQMIDFEFRSKDSNDKKIVKCFDKLGVGLIENFIDGEDVDPEDLESGSEGDSSGSESEQYNYSISESEQESSEEEQKMSRKELQRQKLVEKLKKMKGLGKK